LFVSVVQPPQLLGAVANTVFEFVPPALFCART
jgi:hypothetical protein